jgi:outer membrane protein TolC
VNGAQQGDIALTGEDFGDAISLSASWNLFSGGADRARVFEAKQQRREAAYSRADLRNRVASEVRQDIALLAASTEQVRLQRESVDLVEQNRELAQSEYEAGSASLVRLNEAQRDLTTTYGRLAQALVGYHLARQRLLSATGRNLELFSDALAETDSAEDPATD